MPRLVETFGKVDMAYCMCSYCNILWRFNPQFLKNAGVRTFVGGNLGIPLSEGVLQCLAFPGDDPPFHVTPHLPNYSFL